MSIAYSVFGFLLVGVWMFSEWLTLPTDTNPELYLIAGLLALILGNLKEPR